ncbi:transposase [Streptomyces hilarionis]|uniref:transposase n=1 Tax=Streptomyces hilarionis TaxID=2839954 RepID=UPI002119D736|nr:transposase [Streptomyces hilarionis]MCQ9130222.1 transposase [Streptomyces hilarionis]
MRKPLPHPRAEAERRLRAAHDPALDAEFAEIVRQLLEEGWTIEPEDLARISPYLTERVNRFGEYSTHELGIQPEAYETKLNVDFTQLHEQAPTAADLGQAA